MMPALLNSLTLCVDILLIGDSLGMVLKGEKDTLAVSIDEVAYHTKSVASGAQRCFVMADMPFMTYDTVDKAATNAAKLDKLAPVWSN